MRIAIFTDLYLEIAGGIPSSISAQKTALEQLGHQVTTFCPATKAPKNRSIIALPTLKLKINGAPIARRPKKLIKFIEANFPNFKTDFDLVHVHYEAATSIAGIILAKKYHLPLVQTMHGREDQAVAINVPHPFKTIVAVILNTLHFNGLKSCISTDSKIKPDHYLAPTLATSNMWELMVREANCADQVITPSQHFADKLKHYGVRRSITAVSNGVPDEIIRHSVQTVRTLKKSNSSPLRIIWTNRLSREKRILPFLEALAIVKRSTDQFFFTAVGDGNQIKAAQKFVKRHDLNNNVKFLGAVSRQEALTLLKNEHLSIINSYGFDTQGLTILEAGAVGLPVIYCDPDMNQVVLPGAGLLATDSSPAAMANLILSIIKQPELIENMSRSALSHQHQALQSTQIQQLLKVYRRAVKD